MRFLPGTPSRGRILYSFHIPVPLSAQKITATKNRNSIWVGQENQQIF